MRRDRKRSRQRQQQTKYALCATLLHGRLLSSGLDLSSRVQSRCIAGFNLQLPLSPASTTNESFCSNAPSSPTPSHEPFGYPSVGSCGDAIDWPRGHVYLLSSMVRDGDEVLPLVWSPSSHSNPVSTPLNRLHCMLTVAEREGPHQRQRRSRAPCTLSNAPRKDIANPSLRSVIDVVAAYCKVVVVVVVVIPRGASVRWSRISKHDAGCRLHIR